MELAELCCTARTTSSFRSSSLPILSTTLSGSSPKVSTCSCSREIVVPVGCSAAVYSYALKERPSWRVYGVGQLDRPETIVGQISRQGAPILLRCTHAMEWRRVRAVAVLDHGIARFQLEDPAISAVRCSWLRLHDDIHQSQCFPLRDPRELSSPATAVQCLNAGDYDYRLVAFRRGRASLSAP